MRHTHTHFSRCLRPSLQPKKKKKKKKKTTVANIEVNHELILESEVVKLINVMIRRKAHQKDSRRAQLPQKKKKKKKRSYLFCRWKWKLNRKRYPD